MSRKREPRILRDPPGTAVVVAILAPWLVLAFWAIRRAYASGGDPLRCMVDVPCGATLAAYLLAFFASVALVVTVYAAIFALRAYRIEVRPVVVAHTCSESESKPCKTERRLPLFLQSKKKGFRVVRQRPAKEELDAYYREFIVDFENVGRSPIFSCTVDALIHPPQAHPDSGVRAKVPVGHLGVGRVVHVSLFVHDSIVDDHVISFGEAFRCITGDDILEKGTFRGPGRLTARPRAIDLHNLKQPTDASGDKPPTKDDTAT